MNRFIINLIIIIVAFSLGCNNEKSEQPIAQKGVIDLRNWDFKNDGNIKLNGEWEFYWKQLIQPENFDKHIANKHYLDVPHYWNFNSFGEENLTGSGYATYRLIVLHDTIRDLDVYLGEQMTAYKFWCDTTEIFTCGKVAENKQDALPFIMPVIKTIHLSKDTTQLVFQISNFVHSRGGFYSVPLIGEQSAINVRENKRFAFDLLLIGGILLMAFYFHPHY